MATPNQPVQGPPPPYKWTRQSTAIVVGVVFILAGVAGFGAVSYVWSSAYQCPQIFPNVCAPLPAPTLSTENATVLIIGSVASMAFITLGILFIFVAFYFPVPQPLAPSAERKE
jgi:hypothetical protein